MLADNSLLALFAAVFTINLISQVLAQSEDGACVITETSCPCSQTVSSGVCMKHEGNGMCLLGSCKPSYRCDCMGYEICTRSRCALFTAKENALPSESTPFGCHLTIDAGTCTRFDSVMDTVAAVDNMQTEVNSLNDAVLNENLEAYEMVAAIESDVVVTNDALKWMDQLRGDMTAQEIDNIEKDAELVIDAVEEAGRLALAATQDARKVYTGSRKVARLAAQAKKVNEDAKEAEKRLKIEEDRAEKDGTECSACAALRDEVKILKNESKKAVTDAGQIAKQMREDSRNARAKRDTIREIRSQSDERKAKIVGAVDEVKRRGGRR